MSRLVTALRRPSLQAEAFRAFGGLLQFVVLARLLGAESFGQLAVVALGAALLQPLLTPQIGLALVRAAAGGASERHLVTSLVWSCLRAAGLAAPVALLIAELSLSDVPVEAVLLLWWSELFSLGLLSGLGNIAQGHRNFRRFRALVALATLTRLLSATALLLFPGAGITSWGLILAMTTTPVALAAALWTATRASGHSAAAANVNGSDLWVFSLNTITARLSDDFDKALVAAYAGYAAAGAYTAAYRLASYVMVPVRALLAEFAPRLFAAAADSGAGESVLRQARVAAARVLIAVGVATPPLYAMALLLPQVMGSDYAEVSGYALVLVPALGLRGVHYVFGDVLTATGRVRHRLAAQAASLILPTLACLLLIPRLGAWGAVLSTALAEALAVALMSVMARHVVMNKGEICGRRWSSRRRHSYAR